LDWSPEQEQALMTYWKSKKAHLKKEGETTSLAMRRELVLVQMKNNPTMRDVPEDIRDSLTIDQLGKKVTRIMTAARIKFALDEEGSNLSAITSKTITEEIACELALEMIISDREKAMKSEKEKKRQLKLRVASRKEINRHLSMNIEDNLSDEFVQEVELEDSDDVEETPINNQSSQSRSRSDGSTNSYSSTISEMQIIQDALDQRNKRKNDALMESEKKRLDFEEQRVKTDAVNAQAAIIKAEAEKIQAEAQKMQAEAAIRQAEASTKQLELMMHFMQKDKQK
jgi:hypothetical protein